MTIPRKQKNLSWRTTGARRAASLGTADVKTCRTSGCSSAKDCGGGEQSENGWAARQQFCEARRVEFDSAGCACEQDGADETEDRREVDVIQRVDPVDVCDAFALPGASERVERVDGRIGYGHGGQRYRDGLGCSMPGPVPPGSGGSGCSLLLDEFDQGTEAGFGVNERHGRAT